MHRTNVLTVTVHPVQTGQYVGQPSSRCYQICLPNFWPGMGCPSLSTLSSISITTADNVTISGASETLPYTPLMDSFDEYTQDSWTYDGR